MRRKAISGKMLPLLLIGMLTVASNIQAVKVVSTTIIVPDEYLTIQGAINAANPGDTIYVRAGTYYEHVVANKSVSLIGEDKSVAIVDGSSTGTVIAITQDNVNITGFTIRNSMHEGIDLDNAEYCNIFGNNITSNRYGVYLSSSSNNSISGNNVANNGWNGILLDWSSSNNIFGNNITKNNRYGIHAWASSNNTISGNNITNSLYGFYMSISSKNVLRNNSMAGNTYNFGVGGEELSHFIHDVDSFNMVDNKPVHYLVNQKDLVIDPSTYPSIGYLALVNSTNITVKGQKLRNNRQGILLAYTANSQIANNNITNNELHGVDLIMSSNNNIFGNNITKNNRYGILAWASSNNTISGNNITRNNWGGIALSSSSNNTLAGNTVNLNDRGIRVWESDANEIYLNNFVNNTFSAYSYDSINIWNSPQQITYTYNSSEYVNYVGNYWSDYAGLDGNGDGIGDSDYSIDGEADYHPLMQPFEAYFEIPSTTEMIMNETTSSTHALTETIVCQSATLNTSVTGDFDAALNFTNLEIVLINSGVFTGKGFSKGTWSTNIEGNPHEGCWQGMLLKKPEERKIHLKGMVSGGLRGIVEGFLSESINGSEIYDRFQATWTINHIGAYLVFAKLSLNGTINYEESIEYSSELYALQTFLQGEASGYYDDSLGIVLTHVRVDNETNPYYGEGFSIISYDAEFGSGEGWTYDKIISQSMVELDGLFADPLMGIVSGELDESGTSRNLSIIIERINLGLPPMADLKVILWGSRRTSPGQTITYSIEYRNDGLKTAENVTIVDKLPYHVKYVANTGGGTYKAASQEVIWHLGDIGPMSKDYLTVDGSVLWGLPTNTSFENIASIPVEELEIMTDPTVVTSYELLEISEEYLEATGNISNQIDSGDFSINCTRTTVPEEIEPSFNYNESMTAFEFRVEVTIEGNSWDYYDIVFKYPKKVIDLFDVCKDVYDFSKLRKERKAFLEWSRDHNFISEESYVSWSRYNAGWFVLKSIISGVGKTPLGFGWADIAKALARDDKIYGAKVGLSIAENTGYVLPTEVPDKLREGYNLFTAANRVYLDSISQDTDSHENEIVAARDPNVKYGQEGHVLSGQTLNYTVEYENVGEGIAFGVYFTDTLDEDLNASTLEIHPVISTESGSIIAGPGTYNPSTRTITWLVGEVGPGEGGYANFSAMVRNDVPEYAEIINYATVYFPSVPEATRTNAIVSVVGQPNIAVTNVTASEAVIEWGSTLDMDVTAANRGYFPETFNLALYVNTTAVQTQNITLLGRSSDIITFLWNTTGFAKGNYTLSAYAWPVLGEVETDDNLYVDGIVQVTVSDDVPPVTDLNVGEPKFVIDHTFYLTSATPIMLIAEDDLGGSGVASTAYRIYNATYDGGRTTYTHPFYLIVLGDGTYSIDYNSTDNAGNIESTNIETVILDNTPPTITIGSPTAKDYLHSKTLVIDFVATDEWSGVASISAELDGSPVNNGSMIDLLALTLNSHTLTITAVDNLDHTAVVSVTFNVVADADSLLDLVERFYENGQICDPEVRDGLLDKLHAAKAKIEPGELKPMRNILRAFTRQVRAQLGHHITEEEAYILLTDVEYAIEHL